MTHIILAPVEVARLLRLEFAARHGGSLLSVHARPTTSLGNLLGVGKRPRGVLTREAYALDEMDAMRLTEANSSEALQMRVSGGEPLVTRSAADGDPVFASKRH